MRALVLALIALSGTALANDPHLDFGFAEATLDVSETPHCLVPSLRPCPLGYDDQATLTPSDDVVYQYRSVEAATVVVRGPMDKEVDIDLANTRIPHTLIPTSQAILVSTEASLPPPIGDRTATIPQENATVLMVHLVGLSGTELADAWYPVHVGLPLTNRSGTQVPNGFATYEDDSDLWGPLVVSLLRMCFLELGGIHTVACDALPVASLETSWTSLTPQLLTGVAVNKTRLQLTSAAPLPARSASTATFAPPLPRLPSQGALPLQVTSTPPHHHQAHPGFPGAHLALQTRPPAAPPRGFAGGSQPDFEPGVPWYLLTAAALLLPLALLFHRITRQRALEHTARATLLTLATQRPGLLMADAARELGLSFHATRHHARTLHRLGQLQIIRAGRNLALYPPGTNHHANLVGAAYARGPRGDVLRILLREPGCTISRIATLTNTAKSSTHAKLQRLQTQGLVTRDPQGRYHPTPLGEEAARTPPPA